MFIGTKPKQTILLYTMKRITLNTDRAARFSRQETPLKGNTRAEQRSAELEALQEQETIRSERARVARAGQRRNIDWF